MFDTHCHLNLKEFNNEIDKVISSANAVGVERLVIPGTDIINSKRSVIIAETFKGAYAAVGIHPTENLEGLDLSRVITLLEELCTSKRVVAIGEIGLDYYRYKSATAIQKNFFAAQLDLALKMDKAIIIHNRLAENDLLQILKTKWLPGLNNSCVFHCCETSDELLDFAIKNRVFVGVDGDVTYDSKKQEFIKKVPLDLLLLETDSPLLLPEPLRSQKKEMNIKYNQPANLTIIATKVAEIKNIDIKEVVDITDKNGKFLFNI